MINLPSIPSDFLKIPEINTEFDYNKASDSIAFLKKHIDDAEKLRKTEVAPLVEQKKQIDNVFKSFTTPLEDVVDIIKVKMVAFAQKQNEAQKLLESEIMKNATEDTIIDDLSVQKSKGEFSSSTIKSTLKYRFKIRKLNDIIEIPLTKFKTYLEDGNTMPDFIETYHEDSVVIRKKI
jgi:hypothetical protein